jgi:NitT/TauT family transport system ATP-binding protein
MTASQPALAAHHISHTFGSGPASVEALRDVTLSLALEEIVCLVGPSGCGKSTLLRILAGLLSPTSGAVSIDGQPVAAPHPKVRLIFQQPNLMPWRTVLDNVTLPLELAGSAPIRRTNEARGLLDLVGLTGFESSYPAQLSGGMAQRVAIARALIDQPEVLLMDEPFGALDALTRDTLGEELLRIWQAQKASILMVTHSIPEALLLADRVLVMSPRPGSIEAIIPIDLPRPRTVDSLHTPQAGRLSASIRSALRLAP